MPFVSIEAVTLLARVVFLVAALTDGLAVLPMIFPRIGIALFGGDVPRIDGGYRYAIGIGASLMTGWTLLLLWGAVLPIERRDLLLLTACPGIAGIFVATVAAIQRGVLRLSRVLPLLIHLGLLGGACVITYVLSIPFAS